MQPVAHLTLVKSTSSIIEVRMSDRMPPRLRRPRSGWINSKKRVTRYSCSRHRRVEGGNNLKATQLGNNPD